MWHYNVVGLAKRQGGKKQMQRDKKEEKRWKTAKQERQNPDPLSVLYIMPFAPHKSIKLLAESWQLWMPQFEY